MREIKFRAWDKEELKMKHPISLQEIYEFNGGEYERGEWMQFTGLKDKK